ncbi:hypothetical protein AB1Y20_010104 [Prymnesium parvum]|uniref:Uncharacterized protein n=1 Tax=Prymnesium parvum TaxID=97485 RepID=A0AB34K699_PRYPA
MGVCSSRRLDRVAPPAARSSEEITPRNEQGSALPNTTVPSAPQGVVAPSNALTEADNPPLDQLNRQLTKALKAGKVDQVRALLDQGAELERRGMWDNTPLHLACHYGHSSIALELLQRGASPAAVNEKGCTPLLYACVESMEEVVEKLVELPATEINPPAAPVYSRLTDQTTKRTPLFAAAENGAAPIVALLLRKGATAGAQALPLAAAQGHTAVCVTLLQAMEQQRDLENVTCIGKALLQATRGAHVDAARALLAHRPAAEDVGAALLAACNLGGSGATKPDSKTPGHCPRESLVELLCTRTESLGVHDEEGNTALHLAAKRGLADAAQVLVAAGANLGLLNSKGETAADLAESFGHSQLSSLITSYGGTGHTGSSNVNTVANSTTASSLKSTGLADDHVASNHFDSPASLKPRAQLPPLHGGGCEATQRLEATTAALAASPHVGSFSEAQRTLPPIGAVTSH